MAQAALACQIAPALDTDEDTVRSLHFRAWRQVPVNLTGGNPPKYIQELLEHCTEPCKSQ